MSFAQEMPGSQLPGSGLLIGMEPSDSGYPWGSPSFPEQGEHKCSPPHLLGGPTRPPPLGTLLWLRPLGGENRALLSRAPPGAGSSRGENQARQPFPPRRGWSSGTQRQREKKRAGRRSRRPLPRKPRGGCCLREPLWGREKGSPYTLLSKGTQHSRQNVSLLLLPLPRDLKRSH